MEGAMPWKEVSAMSGRREFVSLATAPGANVRELCRRFQVSPTTAYKWISRSEGEDFSDRSRRPHRSPNRTSRAIEERVLELRDEHPHWNARKIRRVLRNELRCDQLPAASTVGTILKRNGRITEKASAAAHQWQRFEHEAPNDLSQADFMGHFGVGSQRCYALTMIDDHSRYAQLLEACTNERTDTVKDRFIRAFRRYGLPLGINVDNGNPWGNPTGEPYTKLTVWLMRLGVRVSHSRPRHPQTNGKDERFHRTIRAELVGQRTFQSIDEVQRHFDRWRHEYNHERPHEALALEVPASRYAASRRSYPEVLAQISYNEGDVVKTVRNNGMVSLWKNDFYVGQAFAGQPVAFRPTKDDGVWKIYFCEKELRLVDRTDPDTLLHYYRK
jgi:transposase InsO family protein